MDMKPIISIADVAFVHSKGGSFGTGDLNIKPTYFDWRHLDMGNIMLDSREEDLVIVTEMSFNHVDKLPCTRKVALIIEPMSIMPDAYIWILANHNKFEYVLTHNANLASQIPNARLYSFGGCWIRPEDQDIHSKSLNISIIASPKNTAPGHILRHTVIDRFAFADKFSMIDGVYGRGYNPVENKIEALKDFRYSIVIENEKTDTWFTEKLIDCFRTGTVPIFWGTDSIEDYFDMDGVITFDTPDELVGILSNCSEEDYNSRRRAIEKNFALSGSFRIPEDRIWQTFIKPTYFP